MGHDPARLVPHTVERIKVRPALRNFRYPELDAIKANPAPSRTVVHPRWALCLGGAQCVWSDVLQLETLLGHQWDGLVIVANDVGSHWPRPIDHWCSLHPAKMKPWFELRKAQGFPDGFLTWGRAPQVGIDYAVKPWGGGSSGMLAAQIGIEIGCTHVVLCGIPMTQTPHFAESTERHGVEWRAVRGHWPTWEKCKDQLAPYVRSMSGRTKELLGEVTLEWLHAPVRTEGVDETAPPSHI